MVLAGFRVTRTSFGSFHLVLGHFKWFQVIPPQNVLAYFTEGADRNATQFLQMFSKLFYHKIFHFHCNLRIYFSTILNLRGNIQSDTFQLNFRI